MSASAAKPTLAVACQSKANTRGTSAHRVVYSGVFSDCFIVQVHCPLDCLVLASAIDPRPYRSLSRSIAP